ncbi:MAG: MOSC domain-containing protein [Gemmatimonadota bacterium]
MEPTPLVILAEIEIHPIKSTHRIALQEADVVGTGLRFDRSWMVVSPDGSFLTGREHPRLTQIRSEIGDGVLEVRAEGQPALHVPLVFGDDERVGVQVWNDTVDARAVSTAADRWFSTVLGFSCRLVRLDDTSPRAVDPTYARAGDQVGFADGYPLLITSMESLAHLNERLPEPVTMARFRPNLVIQGATPFEEDIWQRLRIGEVEVELVKPCARCVLTTVDPDTGARHAVGEPLRTLNTFRNSPRGVLFGQNAVPRVLGRVRVGDPVEVLA